MKQQERRRALLVRASSGAASTSGATSTIWAGTGSVTDELVRDASRRLAAVLIVFGAGNFLYTILYATLWESDPFSQLLSIGMTVLTLGIGSYVRGKQRSARNIIAAGAIYELSIALCLAVIEYWDRLPDDEVTSKISWICVLIIMYPLLLPIRPRPMLVLSNAVAAMTPVGYAITVAVHGRPIAETATLVSWFLPQFICAAASVLISHVVRTFGEDLSKARRVGAYELVDKLGEGGMGEVWRGQHRLLARPAAVKIIRSDKLSSAKSQTLLERFEREAQTTAGLASAHTVKLYDFGVSSGGALYYVMELLAGLDLEQLVKRFGPIPAGRAVAMALQICDSLHEAHEQGLIHRDIKPANLFVGKAGMRFDFVKVLDFGLVKLDSTEADTTETAEGELRGTPAYMAPEMVTGDDNVDRRADIYAVGCVLCWLLTGELVFNGVSSAVKMAIAHAKDDPIPVSQRTELPISKELDALVLRCLDKRPDQRPETALTLAIALRALPDAGWSDADAVQWWKEHVPEAT